METEPADEDFQSYVIVTRVKAVDQESAQVLAIEEVETAKSLLVMLDERPRPGRDITITITPSGTISRTYPSIPAWITTWGTDAAGKLGEQFRVLSDSAARDPNERTEWEARVLSALRWLLKALESDWPAEILVASLSSLESLFIQGQKRNKGQIIAEAATKHALMTGLTERQQRKWIQRMYKRRNDAIHEGLMYRDELDAVRLRTLTGYLCRWGSAHLSPDHVFPERVCQTQSEALGEH
jgi:hypothetical protein